MSEGHDGSSLARQLLLCEEGRRVVCRLEELVARHGRGELTPDERPELDRLQVVVDAMGEAADPGGACPAIPTPAAVPAWTRPAPPGRITAVVHGHRYEVDPAQLTRKVRESPHAFLSLYERHVKELFDVWLDLVGGGVILIPSEALRYAHFVFEPEEGGGT